MILAPSIVWSADEVPPLLDHILLGSSGLDGGIDFVEERTGVRAAFGGVHPGRAAMLFSRSANAGIWKSSRLTQSKGKKKSRRMPFAS